MTPADARALSINARVERTVEENLSEVARYAKAGNMGSYFKEVWRDPAVNEQAMKKLSDMGYRVHDGHVDW